jgi:hypothetical protein
MEYYFADQKIDIFMKHSHFTACCVNIRKCRKTPYFSRGDTLVLACSVSLRPGFDFDLLSLLYTIVPIAKEDEKTQRWRNAAL